MRVCTKLLGVCSLLLIAQLAAPTVEAKGSSGGRSSSSSSRSSSSSSRSSSSSSRSSYSRSRSSSTSYSRMSTFVLASFSWSVKYRSFRSGYYFSSPYWRQSHSSGLQSDTPLCFNIQDSLPSEYNSSALVPWIYKNQTTYGIFVCPIDSSADKIYCCGDDGAEYCCTFWENTGKVVGVAIGIAFGAAAIGLFAYVCVNCVKGASAGSSSVSSSAKPVTGEGSSGCAGNIDPPPAYPGYYEMDFNGASSAQHQAASLSKDAAEQLPTPPPPSYVM